MSQVAWGKGMQHFQDKSQIYFYYDAAFDLTRD